jgi:hypothetical protein
MEDKDQLALMDEFCDKVEDYLAVNPFALFELVDWDKAAEMRLARGLKRYSQSTVKSSKQYATT